jgi:DNA gyrase/topoisomerase IV subunit B
MELAEAILARREADGCEGATGIEVAEGTVVLSGLEPGGRYFTTVVDERFRAAVAAAWEGARAEFREENQACVAACAARLRLGDRTIPADLHSASAALEVEVRKGVLINRFKGLGEMQSEELGETTLDPETRTLVRVTVADFDEAGRFMGLMLTKSKGGAVEARREVVRAARLGGERVDA